MTIADGQMVWLSFATERGSDGLPYASATMGEVINAEHRIVRRAGGYVGVVGDYSAERIHATEAEAWAANAALLAERLAVIAEKAGECQRRAAEAAAASRVVKVPA